MGGYKYRVFLRKRPGLQNGVRLQGVSAYKGCPLGGVRLYIQCNLSSGLQSLSSEIKIKVELHQNANCVQKHKVYSSKERSHDCEML